MKGKLYGIGVGPGDPELLTLKVVRCIKDADVIVVPGKNPKESVAYQIVLNAFRLLGDTCLEQKETLAAPMPMTKDKSILEQAHEEGTRQICNCLDSGRQVVFLTLGDPTIYSTYIYLHKRVENLGYETEILNGIPSFCAVAARLNIGLVEQKEPLHVIPASYEIGEALHLTGTKVLMKSGKQMQAVKQELMRTKANVMMIENCGMADERIYRNVEEIPETAGYYSLIIVKDKEE